MNVRTVVQGVWQRKLQGRNFQSLITEARLKMKMERYLDTILSGQTAVNHERAEQELQSIFTEV